MVNEMNSIETDSYEEYVPFPHQYSFVKGGTLKKKDVAWIVKGLVPKDALIMVYGSPASTKSFIVLDMMLSIASGKDEWWGHKIKENGQVLYLYGEGGNGLDKRLFGWLMKNAEGESLPDDFIRLDLKESKQSIMLTPETTQEYIRCLKDDGIAPCLICLDTLNTFFTGSENSAEMGGQFLDCLRQFQREFSSTVMFVHHTRKANNEGQGGETERGSSSLLGGVDSSLHLKVISEESTKTSKTVGLTIKKMKDGRDGTFYKVKLNEKHLWTDDDNEAVTTLVVESMTESVPPVATKSKDKEDKLKGFRDAIYALYPLYGENPEPVEDIGDGMRGCKFFIRRKKLLKGFMAFNEAKETDANNFLNDARDPLKLAIARGIVSKVPDGKSWKLELIPKSVKKDGFSHGRLENSWKEMKDIRRGLLLSSDDEETQSLLQDARALTNADDDLFGESDED